MDISLQLSMLLWISIWISMDSYGYPCIDLPWILDSGIRLTDLEYPADILYILISGVKISSKTLPLGRTFPLIRLASKFDR